MGVHTQGESGFFDEDTELPLEQNEIVEQHETANSETVGKSAATFMTSRISGVDSTTR